MAEAIDLVRKKRDEHGRWPLENPHPGPVHFEMEGRAGEPSRWNTLRTLRGPKNQAAVVAFGCMYDANPLATSRSDGGRT
jgi:hypothetical protein